MFPSVNSDGFGTAYSGKNYGFFWAAKACAAVFGGGVGAAIATNYGWQTAFWVTACTSFIAFFIATFVIPKMGKPTKHNASPVVNADKQLTA